MGNILISFGSNYVRSQGLPLEEEAIAAPVYRLVPKPPPLRSM